ncbi:hypothetical protein [Flavobacterium anhuiense]|uniref:hypothetical protein n=1 Tax=Flavobacterium anhuiense TaxID=459526 RepID=UPI0034D97675
MDRLIKQEDIPISLWKKKEGTLILPYYLLESWKLILEKRNLLKTATEERGDGETGGINEEATHKHYSFRYNGSCARFQLTFLDPKNELKDVSNAFVKCLAGNDVFIADIPSGTGAASLSLLCNIAQLREENILPRIPLKVKILAGEISQTAIEIFQHSFEEMNAYFKTQSIEVELKIKEWDVQDADSTSQLIKEITIFSNNSTNKILLLTNFTGFLEQDRKWKEVKDKFEEIFRHFSGQSTIAIWLEPKMGNVLTQFWPRTIKWFTDVFKNLIGAKENINIETSHANYEHGLRDGILRTNVAVVKFNTERE